MPMPRYRSAVMSICTVALLLFFNSCGPSTNFYRDVDAFTSQGNYGKAVDEVKKNERGYGDKSTVLYKLELGALYHYAGEMDSSNRYLLEAEKDIDDLFTKSISLNVLSVILNDNILPYDGEDFEKVLVNVFLALNFAAKGMDEDALVEARKVDTKLREYSRQYSGQNKYQEDAFIRCIAGVLYENEGEINDAFISYRQSYETYETYAKEYGTKAPAFLLNDIVRTAARLGFRDEVEKYSGLGGGIPDDNNNQQGSILVVTYSGKGPIKIQNRKTVTIPDSAGTLHTFQIALPKFTTRYSSGRWYSVSATSAGNTRTALTEVAENINAIAAKTLDDRLGMVYLKSGGRAVVKFLAAETAKKEFNKGSDSKITNFLKGLLVDVAVGATEQADTRTWRMLPANIQLARLHLAAGVYQCSISASDGGYDKRVTIEVKSGKTAFVLVDDLR